jgi:purine-binding chemotaxis protein CheW
MTGPGSGDEFLEFEVGGRRYGIRVIDVVELLRAVTIIPLPRAPGIVEGVITVRGAVVPVLDFRARFKLAPKPATSADQLMVVRVGARRRAFRIDRAIDLVRVDPSDIEDVDVLMPGVAYVAGVAKLSDRLMLIHDFRTFLSRAEADALAALEHEMATS